MSQQHDRKTFHLSLRKRTDFKFHYSKWNFLSFGVWEKCCQLRHLQFTNRHGQHKFTDVVINAKLPTTDECANWVQCSRWHERKINDCSFLISVCMKLSQCIGLMSGMICVSTLRRVKVKLITQRSCIIGLSDIWACVPRRGLTLTPLLVYMELPNVGKWVKLQQFRKI